MTEWIRIITLATQGTQVWTIITLIRSTTQSAKIDLRHTLKLSCNENYRNRISESVLVSSVKKGTYTFRKSWEQLTELIRNKYVHSLQNSQHLFLNRNGVSTTDFWLFLGIAHSEISILQQDFPIHPSRLYGASPETTPRTRQFLIPEAIRNTCKLCLVPWGYSLAPNVATKHLKDGSEQAADESWQLCKSTIIVVQLRVIDFQFLCLIKMQRIKWKPGWN